MAVRTGGLHTLANAILQQKKISRLKREMCPSVGSQIAFLTVLFKLVSPCFFFPMMPSICGGPKSVCNSLHTGYGLHSQYSVPSLQLVDPSIILS